MSLKLLNKTVIFVLYRYIIALCILYKTKKTQEHLTISEFMSIIPNRLS